MNLIITKNERKFLRKIYKDLKNFIILDKFQIVQTLGYTKENYNSSVYSQFVINNEISEFLGKAISNKKNKDVIYILDDLDRNFFINLFNFLEENPTLKNKVGEIILIDFKEELTHLYTFVNKCIQKSNIEHTV